MFMYGGKAALYSGGGGGQAETVCFSDVFTSTTGATWASIPARSTDGNRTLPAVFVHAFSGQGIPRKILEMFGPLCSHSIALLLL